MALSDKVVTKAGFQLIVKSGTVSKLVQEAILEGLGEVSKNYMKQVDKNLSLDDHTLQELAALGHPYSVNKPKDTPHDDRLIHEQSGKLRKSIKASLPEEVTSRRFTVYVTTNDPIAPYLIWGTSRMRPRRFHEKSFNDIKDKYWSPITERLAKLNYKMTIGAASARQIG
jgi:hypothetical protein